MRVRRNRVGAAAWAIGMAAGSAAWAQTGADEAARTNMIDQAVAAQRTGDHARAVDLATRANTIRMTGTLLGFIAREQVALGRVADALGSVELCAREAPNEPASRNRDTILNWCRTQLPTLRAAVGRVVITLSGHPEGVRVTVAGRELNAALLGVDYVVNPGAVVVEASAPGYVSFRRELTVSAGPPVSVPVELVREPAAVSAVVGTGGSSAGSGHSDARAGGAAPSYTTRSSLSPVGPVILGVGAASLIGSAVAWVVADGSVADARRQCDMGACPSNPDGVRSSVDLLDTVTTATLIGGGVLVGLGAVLTFTVRNTERVPQTAPPAGSASVGVTPGGITLRGVF